jgi:hypothetical protein
LKKFLISILLHDRKSIRIKQTFSPFKKDKNIYNLILEKLTTKDAE